MSDWVQDISVLLAMIGIWVCIVALYLHVIALLRSLITLSSTLNDWLKADFDDDDNTNEAA